MANDRRKKCCPNEQCEMHKKKKTKKASEKYCSICGTQLVYVCAKCFKEIEDKGVEHRVCRHCEAQSNSRTAEFADKGKQILEYAGPALIVPAGKAVLEKAAPVVKPIFDSGKNAFMEEFKKEAKKNAVRAGKAVAKGIDNGKIKK